MALAAGTGLGLEAFQKGPLLTKVWALLKSGIDKQRQWCGFCTAHEAPSFKPTDQDEAFLLTFLDAVAGDGIPPFEGQIPEEIASMCPAPAAVWDSGKGGSYGDTHVNGVKGWGKGCGWDGGNGKNKGFGDKGAWSKGGFGGAAGAFGGGGFDKGCSKGADEPGKIFIGGLPKMATEEHLVAMLLPFGKLRNVTVKYGEDGLCKGFAFATFEDPSIIPTVLSASEAGATTVGGQRVACKIVSGKPFVKGGNPSSGWDGGGAKGSSWDGGSGKGGKGDKGGSKSGGSDESKIFVGGLPKTTNEANVAAAFAQYGQVDKVIFKVDEFGQCRGFCFVVFSDAATAQAVIAQSQMGWVGVDGKRVDCKSATADAGKDGCKGGKGGKPGFGFDWSGGKGGGDRPAGGDWKRPRTDGWGGGAGGGWGGGWSDGGKKGGTGKGWGK